MNLSPKGPMLGHKSSFFCAEDDVFSWLVENRGQRIHSKLVIHSNPNFFRMCDNDSH
jgi:hypothetical protein